MTEAAKEAGIEAMAEVLGPGPLTARLQIRRGIGDTMYAMWLAHHPGELEEDYPLMESDLATLDPLPVGLDGMLHLGGCEWPPPMLMGKVEAVRIYRNDGTFFMEARDLPGVIGQIVGTFHGIVLPHMTVRLL